MATWAPMTCMIGNKMDGGRALVVAASRVTWTGSTSVLLTFAACGACHDILFLFPAAILRGDFIPLPFMTSWFLIIGVGILVVDHLRIRFDALHSLLRVPIHAGFLFVTFYLTRFMDRLV